MVSSSFFEVERGRHCMNSHVDCIACIVSKASELADKYIAHKKDKYIFMEKVLLEIAHSDEQKMAPYIMSKVMRLLSDITGITDFYVEEKRLFNDKILEMEGDIRTLLDRSDDAFLDALKLAMSGNIVDFGAFSHITIDMVKDIMEKTIDSYLDLSTYERLLKELGDAHTLLYLADNTGEIVFDKMFLAEIKNKFPKLDICLATRGMPALNDATEVDAYYVGIQEYATIINNGTDIPGTDLSEVSQSFKATFNQADVILAKGQGNFETLCGCGHNIYYLFLCKCEMMTERMGTENLSPMFLHEKTMENPLIY